MQPIICPFSLYLIRRKYERRGKSRHMVKRVHSTRDIQLYNITSSSSYNVNPILSTTWWLYHARHAQFCALENEPPKKCALLFNTRDPPSTFTWYTWYARICDRRRRKISNKPRAIVGKPVAHGGHEKLENVTLRHAWSSIIDTRMTFSARSIWETMLIRAHQRRWRR